MEHEHPDPVHAGRRRRVLITGAGGQLGRALQGAFAGNDVVALTRADWDVAHPASAAVARSDPDLVLHTAAWTDVDGAEADPQGAGAVNIAGVAHAAALKVPLVTFSTDSVFDGRKGSPYVESDGPNPPRRTGERSSTARRPQVTAPGSCGHRGCSGRPVTTSFARCFGSGGARRGRRGRRPAGLSDLRGASGRCRARARRRRPSEGPVASRRRWGLHVGGLRRGGLRGRGLECRVRRISTAELERLASRPAYSVLRSERAGAPALPDWREGLRACLAEMDG